MELYDPQGRRLYLTAAERRAFLKAARDAPREVRTFCLVLHDTGCRISEALALTPRSVDLSGKAIVFETLKKRRSGVYRAVPVPDSSLDILNTAHGLIEAHRSRRKGVADRRPCGPGDAPRPSCASRRSWRRRRGRRRPPQVPQGPAPRLRCECDLQRGAAQHALQVDGAGQPGSDGDLCQRPGRGTALNCRADVGGRGRRAVGKRMQS